MLVRPSICGPHSSSPSHWFWDYVFLFPQEIWISGSRKIGLCYECSIPLIFLFWWLLQSAQIALSALINAMEETGKVALVRRVYQLNSRVTLGVLSPKIKFKYEVYSKCNFI